MKTNSQTVLPTPRISTILGLRLSDLSVLAGYLTVLCFMVSRYQPWEDEGRAWIIVRNSSLLELLFHQLRPEGHPSLWYLVLWVPTHLHLPYLYINWISAIIASAGIYFLLRYSPFPWYLRCLLPFGFALQYQYAVVARSYVLFPLLGFIVAHLYRKRLSNPIPLAIALALFANISLHSTLIATGLAVCYWWSFRRSQSWVTLPPADRRTFRVATLIFVAGIALVAACIWPDHKSGSDLMAKWRNYHPSLVSLRGGSPATPTPQVVETHRLALTGPIQGRDFPVRSSAAKLVQFITYPVASFYPLALAFEALVGVYLYYRRCLILAIPVALLVGFLAIGYKQLWHLEMLWVTLLMVLWIAWDDSGPGRQSKLQWAIQGALAIVCILQLPWTIGAVRYELNDAMFPSETAANYLSTIRSGKRISGYGRSKTLLPYFSDPIFTEYSGPSTISLLESQPDLILGDDSISTEEIAAFATAHYRFTRSFCGSYYFPDTPPEPLCLLFFEKNQ